MKILDDLLGIKVQHSRRQIAIWKKFTKKVTVLAASEQMSNVAVATVLRISLRAIEAES